MKKADNQISAFAETQRLNHFKFSHSFQEKGYRMVKARLLIVDDEPTLINLFTRRLQRLSYQVFSARSGPEALDILQREEIDVLITDFKMPIMDGCEIITRALKIDPMLQSIVVTGYSDLRTAINVMGAGAFNYLEKPIDFAELDIVIERGLEKRKLLRDVQNKQRQLEEYREHLEELVAERTSELTEANRKLTREIEERKCLEDTLREAKRIAENANKAKSEFLANMSHEIRTPMTSAIGLLNLVLETELLPKQKAYLEMARISTVIMHNLLNDILDFSKIEAGRLTLESISFEPRKVIESVIDLQHLHAEEKSIQLTFALADDVPSSVIGDPNRLRQIILNLVSNAIKFTHYGEILIMCCRAIGDKALAAKDPQHVDLLFSVRDSGIGIDNDKIELIFEAFTQADSSTTRKFGGVGLGLNICSKLVAMMGGRIWVESQPGRGSTFYFTSRLAIGPPREKIRLGEVAESISTTIEPVKGRPLSVLVVEDDETNQWLVNEILKAEGHTVTNVSDGREALRKIDNQQFDLVLLDLKLPQISGYEVVNLIRNKEKAANVDLDRHLPILAMTGLALDGEKQRCLDAGMDDFLAKPFTVDQLLAKIWKYARDRSDGNRISCGIAESAFKDISVLESEIFNEDEALKRANGSRDILLKRIDNFLQKTPHAIGLLRKTVQTGDKEATLLEQEIQNLKESAMKIGATNFADELFSLLLELRNKEDIKESQMDIIDKELEFFKKELRTRRFFDPRDPKDGLGTVRK
jgi:signal transduction histidine kinase